MPRVRKMTIVGTGMQANGQKVDKAMLESVVSNFKKASRPPITLGHPKKGQDQIAALGRVDNLRTELSREFPGETELLGEIIYTPELEALEDSGAFEGFSAGIYPHPDKSKGWFMHHTASLGQLPPAADTKTHDVVQLSSDDDIEHAIILSVHTAGGTSTKEIENMDKEELAKAISDGIKAAITPFEERLAKFEKSGEKGKPTKEGADKGEVEGGKGAELPEVTAMRSSMADERKETLTELADTREIGEDTLKTIKAMVDSSTPIELCASGESSRYSTVKAMIKSFPVKGTDSKTGTGVTDEWGELTKSIELSNDPKLKKDDDIFSMKDF